MRLPACQFSQILNGCFWQMLRLSASLRGFFLMHYGGDFKNYMQKLVGLYKQGKITSTVDPGDKSVRGAFVGLDRVNDAVEVRHSRDKCPFRDRANKCSRYITEGTPPPLPFLFFPQ